MMSIITRTVEHTLDGETFENLFVFDEAKQGKRPTVLVFHAWEGRSADQEKFARQLTAWGYAAMAVDLYGKGKHGSNPQECQALMMPLVQDRAMLRKRLLKAVDVARSVAEADGAQLGAIGFCFGGLCALDLARAGAGLKGVASFHGALAPNNLTNANPIATKVIAFHGWDDPFAKPDQVVSFNQEMTDARADWQFVAYGGTQHAFMNEGANMPQMGLLYDARAAGRAWKALRLFLAEAFES